MFTEQFFVYHPGCTVRFRLVDFVTIAVVLLSVLHSTGVCFGICLELPLSLPHLHVHLAIS